MGAATRKDAEAGAATYRMEVTMPIELISTEFVADDPMPYMTLAQDWESRAVEFDRRAAEYRAKGLEAYAVNCERKAEKKRLAAAEMRAQSFNL